MAGSLTCLCEWMMELRSVVLAKGENLLRLTWDRKLWRALVIYVLKERRHIEKDLFLVSCCLHMVRNSLKRSHYCVDFISTLPKEKKLRHMREFPGAVYACVECLGQNSNVISTNIRKPVNLLYYLTYLCLYVTVLL